MSTNLNLLNKNSKLINKTSNLKIQKKKANPKAPKKNEVELLPPAPNPWRVVKPNGLFVLEKGVQFETGRAVWDMMTKEDFPWVQRFKRFPKTAHYNWYSYGPFEGEAGQLAFEQQHPLIFKLASQAVEGMKNHLREVAPEHKFLEHFLPETVNIHRHKPNWGLGGHYDNAKDVGDGMVLMISLGEEFNWPMRERKPRMFVFDDPPSGRWFPVYTNDCQVMLFADAAYDYWRHMSERDKHQTGTCLSFTIRLKKVCGYHGAASDSRYSKGAPAAQRIAHQRIRQLIAEATDPANAY